MKTKVLLSLAIFICAAMTANAQINEGRFLLGGSASFYSSTNLQYSNLKSEALNTSAQFGKVVKENTVVGVILSYGYSNIGSANKTKQFSGGLFYRKYKTLAKNFYFFGEGDAVYSHSTINQEFKIGNNGYKNSSNGGTISFTPGISYSVCKRMQMELLMPNVISLSYAGSKTETTSIGSTSISTTKGHSFSANANLNSNLLNSFGIGFKFLLGK
ncbi:MAG: hypothetical protein ABI237_10050 [Ginsengibacter sp.]